VALAGIGITTAAVLCQLIAGLDDPDLIMRKSCEEALQKSGSKAVPLISDAAGGHAIHIAPQVELCLSLSARLVAIKILGLIPDASAALCLMNQLKDPEEIVRYRTVAALGNFKEAQVRSALVQVMRNDPSRRVRIRARQALQAPMRRNVVESI